MLYHKISNWTTLKKTFINVFVDEEIGNDDEEKLKDIDPNYFPDRSTPLNRTIHIEEFGWGYIGKLFISIRSLSPIYYVGCELVLSNITIYSNRMFESIITHSIQTYATVLKDLYLHNNTCIHNNMCINDRYHRIFIYTSDVNRYGRFLRSFGDVIVTSDVTRTDSGRMSFDMGMTEILIELRFDNDLSLLRYEDMEWGI